MGTELPTAAPAKACVQGRAQPCKHCSHLPSKHVIPSSPPHPSLRMQSETWGGLWAPPGWEVPPASLCFLLTM